MWFETTPLYIRTHDLFLFYHNIRIFCRKKKGKPEAFSFQSFQPQRNGISVETHIKKQASPVGAASVATIYPRGIAYLWSGRKTFNLREERKLL